MRWLHQTCSEQRQEKPGPIIRSPVKFVNKMLYTRGLCLAVSKQLFVFEMLESIVPPTA